MPSPSRATMTRPRQGDRASRRLAERIGHPTRDHRQARPADSVAADRAGRRGGAERRVCPARGRQPRLRQRALQDASAGGGLAARATRLTGIAIVGTGMWAPRLAAAAQRADLELVTCHSRDAGRREAFAERFGCPPAATIEDVVGQPDVKGVVLANPNDVHLERRSCAPPGDACVRGEADRRHRRCGSDARRLHEAGVALMVGHAFRAWAPLGGQAADRRGAHWDEWFSPRRNALPAPSSPGAGAAARAQPGRTSCTGDSPRRHAGLLAGPGAPRERALRPRPHRGDIDDSAAVISSSSPALWGRSPEDTSRPRRSRCGDGSEGV